MVKEGKLSGRVLARSQVGVWVVEEKRQSWLRAGESMGGGQVQASQGGGGVWSDLRGGPGTLLGLGGYSCLSVVTEPPREQAENNIVTLVTPLSSTLVYISWRCEFRRIHAHVIHSMVFNVQCC